MQKPSGAFFDALGSYVYEYYNPETEEKEWFGEFDSDGERIYVGKGTGDRCWHHTLPKQQGGKGLDPAHLRIVACNLEVFDEKKDGTAFAIESLLYQTHKHTQNSVSGHYKEHFPMKSIASMFSEFAAAQHDNFEAMPDWYAENYDEVFRGKVRELKICKSNVTLTSTPFNSTYIQFSVDPSVDAIKVVFEVNQDGEKLESIKAKVIEWLEDEENGFEVYPDSAKKFFVFCDDVERAVQLFSAFTKG